MSNKRSQEIAKIAHQFNKNAGSRELTEKDANSFAKDIIGKSIGEIEQAVKKSMRAHWGFSI